MKSSSKTCKAFSAILPFILLFLISCTNNENPNPANGQISQISSTSASTAAVTETVSQSTAAVTSTTYDTTAPAENETTAIPGVTTTAPSGSLPDTKEEILALYTSVTKKIKDEIVGFSLASWMKIENEKIQGLGKALIEPMLSRMPSEAEAKGEKKFVIPKGDPTVAERFPVCSLTDLSVIESAACTSEGENYIIEMTFSDRKNPKKDDPLSTVLPFMMTADDMLEGVNSDRMKNFVKSIDKINIDYNDCKIRCKFNPETLIITELQTDMTMFFDLDAKLVVGSLTGSADIVSHMYIFEFVY